MAVVGVGFWGRNHARVYSSLDSAELVGVVDQNRELASVVAQKYHCRSYLKPEELLVECHPDAVSVCTPSATHAKVASLLVQKGVNVLVEKPFTATIDEGRDLLNLIHEKKVIATVGFIERFNSAVVTVKKWVEEGRLGMVSLFYSRRVSSWPERIGDVGVVKDTAIHDIDLTRFILGKDPESIYAVIGRSRNSSQEDYANILMKTDGSSAFIESNWLTPYKERQLVVTGSEATVTANYITQGVTIHSSDGSFTPQTAPKEPLVLELENFVRCVRSHDDPHPSAEDGLKALIIAELSLRSSASGQVVKVEL